jgi:formate/nitrite transporter FocA (FNT family)
MLSYQTKPIISPTANTMVPAMPAPVTGIQTALAIEAALLATAKIRANRPIDQTFFLAIIAGLWVGFGGIAALSAASGVPESVRASWPIVPKFLMGAFFAFGGLAFEYSQNEC